MIFNFGIQKTARFLSCFIIIAFILSPSFAEKTKQTIDKNFVPACLLDWRSGPEYAVLVDKSIQKVMVYRRGNLYNPFKVYNCSTGENDGPKQKMNDRRTPEGIYYFLKSFDEKYLSPIYGTKALTLDYPNVIDRRNGRDGYGIWFHGTNKALKPNDSNGCIVLNNRDIEELANIVTLFETPVIISSRIELVPERDNENKKRVISYIIEYWRKAWEDKEIEKYMSFYSKKFKSGWRDWQYWKAHKKRLAEKYTSIEVEVNELNLFSHEGIIIASFEQIYRTPSYFSLGMKKLYLTQNSAEWRIIAETFTGNDEPIFAPQKADDF